MHAGRGDEPLRARIGDRDEPVQDWRAHDLIIRAVDCRAITASHVPEVVQEWREPSHREFRPRNLRMHHAKRTLEFYFTLDVRNGEVTGSSQMYASKATRSKGIRSVMANAPSAGVAEVGG